MKCRFQLEVLTLLYLIVVACAVTGSVQPYSAPKQIADLSEEESRLWHQADDMDAQIAKRGALYADADLTSYLQGIMDGLYPELDGAIRVNVIKAPTLNAFALPNGSVYFHLGMLARLQNEAQVATVLAHEGAHFVNRHSLRQMRTVKSGTAAAQVINIAGVPLVGDLIAISSMYGYSRDLEREADRVGWDRLVAAGYDSREAARTFEHLLAEAKALDTKEPFFFSSHPRLAERIESFRELERGQSVGGSLGRDQFLTVTANARIDTLEEDLGRDRCESVILVLSDRDRIDEYPPYAFYYLGEAYRRRGDEGDRERAIEAFQKALEAAPDFAPTYQALGEIYLKDKDYVEARTHFSICLRLAPEAADRAYVERYLEIIQKELGQ
jgi:predicted Zn-dependent protease